MMKKRARGFTLVELLTVIAIIAILVGLLLPVLALAKKHAKSAGTKATIHNMKIAVNNYQLDYGSYPIAPGGSQQLHLGTPGYYPMICAALDQKSTGTEDNSPLITMLRDEKFLDVSDADIVGDNLVDKFYGRIMIRFLVLTSDDTDPDPEKLTEKVFIWSYGADLENAVEATEDYTHLGAPTYDNAESDTIEASPDTSKKDDITSWK